MTFPTAIVFDRSQILRPNQSSDNYPLGLAVVHGGRLATLDRAAPLPAVRGGTPNRLVAI